MRAVATMTDLFIPSTSSRRSTGTIRAYEAMMYGLERDDPETRSRWRDLLRQYCRLDTLAMVWIWRHWHTVRP